MNPIDTQPDALRLANTLERCLQDLPDEVGLRLHRDFLTEVASELRRLHAELDRLRQAQGGEAVAMPDKVATAVLDTPEPDKWVDCGEARPLPMFHMATLMQYGERCAQAALSTFTPDVKTVVTDEMVSRFLSWKLPKDFYPDSFISFDREKHDAWGGYPNSWPTGTNLLNAEQAKEMLQHVLGNTSPPLQADAKVPQGWKLVPVEILDRFPEINPSNYDHDDACALNDWGVEVVLSASPAAPQQWQPIETAPKNSHARLVWEPKDQNIFCVSWSDGYGDDSEAGWYVFGAGGFMRPIAPPTHWMPLPAAPSTPPMEQK